MKAPFSNFPLSGCVPVEPEAGEPSPLLLPLEKADRAKRTITFLLPKGGQGAKGEVPEEQEVVEDTEAGEVEGKRGNKWRHDQKEVFSYPDLDPPASGYRSGGY